MAKQKGIIKLEGTIGDITFFKSQDGYLAREHAPITAAQIATDPAFQRTRENNAEFGRAGKASAIFRKAFRQAMQTAKDGRVTARLTAGFSKVIKADQTNPRGMRNVIDGEAELLEGFSCNKNAAINSTLYAPFTAVIDRPTGVCSISVQSFVPVNAIAAPSGSTHFKMLAMAAAIDFENEQYNSQLQETALLPLTTDPAGPLNLSCNLPPAATQPLFLMLGIQFFQQVNGISYPLKDGGFNALELVKVSGL